VAGFGNWSSLLDPDCDEYQNYVNKVGYSGMDNKKPRK